MARYIASVTIEISADDAEQAQLRLERLVHKACATATEGEPKIGAVFDIEETDDSE